MAHLFDKKNPNYKTPDLSKFQEVIINSRTRIYVEQGIDPEVAKSRYLKRLLEKKP